MYAIEVRMLAYFWEGEWFVGCYWGSGNVLFLDLTCDSMGIYTS